MFKLAVFFGCFVAAALSAHSQMGMPKTVEVDKTFLMKQKSILQLLAHIHQPVLAPELKEMLNNFDLEQNVNNFNDARTVTNFMKLYKSGSMMNRRKIFTPLYGSHVSQANIVFEILQSAKDWEMFLKTAIWMREHINTGLFIYSFYVSVLHHPETQGIILPPLYEVCPHLFVSAEVIQKAYDSRMVSCTKPEKDAVVLMFNYTGWPMAKNPELQVSYFTEDVGLNNYHFFHHISYPHWMKKKIDLKVERPGELFYYLHAQLLARYKMERRANRMPPMKNFTYEEPNMIGYDPNLRYMNGKSVPVRPERVKLVSNDVMDIERIRNYENRIRDAIDRGYVMDAMGNKVSLMGTEGIETLGRLMEKTPTSPNPRYYNSMYRIMLNLLGHVVDPYHENNVAPGVLEHYQSMLRDPMYYRLYQRIQKLFTSLKETLPVYTKENLQFPGVHIENVEVDKLMTFFEIFEIDITNVVGVNKMEDDKFFKIVARQPRLNHKDFTFRIKVNSDRDVKGMVHVYLAPKYDMSGMRELSMSERKEYMILMDKFPYKMKNGKNVIERSSKDSSVTTGDMMSFRLLFKKVEEALQGRSTFNINDNGLEYGFPRRLLLPKGSKSGAPYVMYVVISPDESRSQVPVRGIKTFTTCGGNLFCGSDYPLGYPFDREIVESEYAVPNIRMTDVNIYHKKMEDPTSDI